MDITYKTLSVLTLLGASCISAAADNYNATLDKIINNNPGMVASFAALDAEKAENLTGLNLANPEVGLSYQWGVPSDVPDKKTIDVSQEFDFATLSGAKKRLAKVKNKGAEAAFRQSLRAVAAEADALMTDIVYQRRLAQHYDSAINLMNRTLSAGKAALEQGQITIVDFNGIRMDLNALETDRQLNEIDYQNNLSSLAALGGSTNINWTSSDYADYNLPADFSQWLEENRVKSDGVIQARAEQNVAEGEISLRKSENLPTFSLGYTSELVKDANYHGVTLGIGLPLWANAGRVKAARAAANAAQIAGEKAALDFELKQRALYDKALVTGRMLENTRTMARDCDIHRELDKLFSSGQISAHEYMAQLLSLLELNKKVIESEYAWQKALADFRAATIR